MRQRRVQFNVQFVAGCIVLLAALVGQGVAQRGAHTPGTLAASPFGQVLTTLASFDGSDGAEPFSSLIQGADGNFYGTTYVGGTIGDGTVFKITPAGSLTTLYSFCSQANCADGVAPYAGLVQGGDGNFYGTTVGGGTNFEGTVFKITPSGSLTTLYSFCSQASCVDGAIPYAGLVQGGDGNFYGTTFEGGTNSDGTVFKITPAGSLTTLYSFCSQANCADGAFPYAGLVQGSDGNFYGTTFEGGTNSDGTVFKITPAGSLTTLYSFCSQANCADGAIPFAGLVQGSDGNFYGTTFEGATNGDGTVFKITPAGSLTTLYSFCSQSNCTDGALPYAGLVQGSDGNFYGTTLDGGAVAFVGTVFEITPAGSLTTLYSFCSQSNCTDGEFPYAGLVQGGDGNFYGTTFEGGANGDGTVFSLTPGQAGLALACPSQTAEVGVAYSSALGASGGTAPYTFSIISGSLPSGLTLNTSTGAITGTPTTSGTFSFTAQVVDSQSSSATANCSITVAGTGTDPTSTNLSLAPESLPVGSSGPVVMTATVAPISGGGTPTGTVSYFDGSNSIGSSTLSGGIARFNFNPSGLGAGIHPITAVYSGDSTFSASTSPAQNLTITAGQGFATLVNFDGSVHGSEPFFGNIQIVGQVGYGMTAVGGTYDQGVLFQATADGTLTTLYTFCQQINCTDGAEPFSGPLVFAGNIYGTTYWGGANGVGEVFEVTPSGQLTTLHSFCSQPNCTDGQDPFAGLVQVGGNFYGTTSLGGANGAGTIFEISPAGQFTTLYSFCSQANCTDGAFPLAGLLLGADGNLYGTTNDGGANNQGGTVFKITPAGQLTTLYSFCSQVNCTDGGFPYAALVQAADGTLYGTTVDGGANGDAGTIFSITSAGQVTTLHSFCSSPGCPDGVFPSAPLVLASDGNFYGTTSGGTGPDFSFSFGTVFGITPSGQLTTLHTFAVTDGAYPDGGLAEASNGNLYGMTYFGGSSDNGTIFSLPVTLDVPQKAKAGDNTALSLIFRGADVLSEAVFERSGKERMFPGFSQPGTSDRKTFGGNRKAAVFARMNAAAIKAKAPGNATAAPNLATLTSILNFDGANGASPFRGSLIQGTDGNLYGTDELGGTADQGTVFQVTPDGTLTTLYTFCSQTNCTDGAEPFAGLVQAANGNFYGTTTEGGNGAGTVFEVSAGGQFNSLYNFCSKPGCADGVYTQPGLMQASDGNLYGANSGGGANGRGGTVFKMTPAGALTTLYSFCSQPGCADGSNPIGTLMQASNGNLYGTTRDGGATGGGTIFQITTAGLLTTLYSFCSQPNCADGANPTAGLLQATDGNLYGTTLNGGAAFRGTVFQVTLTGALTTLYSFCARPGCTDGARPQGPLVLAGSNLYGTTRGGGNGFGTVFQITQAGVLTTLYSFNLLDGAFPYSGLVPASDGKLYGMTAFGGNRLDGTIYSLPVGTQTLALSCPSGTAQVGVAYNSALTATGGVGPYTFSIITGSLPPGLSLNGSTGAITGTPTTQGTYGFTAQVVDSLGNTATSSCSIVVSSPTLTLTCPAGNAQVGVAYNSALTASGGIAPYTFSIAIGALPPGLSLNTSTGAITGTPTTAGSFSFTAQVIDSQENTATSSCSIVVSAITLSCPTGTAQMSVAYSSALTATGGVAPYTFSIISGALPPGLSLNSSTGAITGTPTMQGTYSFTAQVVDSQENTATASCSIVVTRAGATPTTTSLTLTPPSVPLGSAGPIVMTATVTPVSGTGTPTGTVTYFNGSTQIGTATLSGGVGTFNYNPSGLAVGLYSITAVYSGDGNFSASTSPAQTLAITQTGPFAYVANINSNTVSVINIPTGQVTNSIVVGSGPWGTAISPDQTQVYVTNNHGNNVSAINAASGSVVATIPVQLSPFGVAFTPDGKGVYVVNGSSNSVSVIDPATQTVVATVPVQNSPVGVAMAPTSNGTFAYVTNSGSNTVSVIAVGSNPSVVQTIPVGTGPRWVTVSPNSMWAYVENAGSNNVSVISVATNQVTTTISVGTSPFGAAFTPDNSTVYVANSGSNNVSVIDTKTTTVIGTVSGLNNPVQVALTTDGSSAYVTNLNANTVSVIATAGNTISGTVQVGNAPIGVAMAAAPQLTLQITQPLSPTQPNNFNFGSNNYAVQYPPNTQFSGVNMTITAVEITQAQFQQRVAGTRFANASCIVYGGGAGNCIDDQVTCSDNNGNPITCPAEPDPTIGVQTSFTTSQTIINPGYLTTPIGQNQWQDIFSGFSDPTVKGKTQGFSEFIAVDLGATNPQGAAHFHLIRPTLPRNYEHGQLIPIIFRLTSVVTGKPVTDAKAGLSVVMIADAKGHPTQTVIFARNTAFRKIGLGKYEHNLYARKYAPGTYQVTIYGDAFPAFQGQFKILH